MIFFLPSFFQAYIFFTIRFIRGITKKRKREDNLLPNCHDAVNTTHKTKHALSLDLLLYPYYGRTILYLALLLPPSSVLVLIRAFADDASCSIFFSSHFLQNLDFFIPLHVFTLFDSCSRTDRPTDGRTDKGSYRVACPQLKIFKNS